eukprot:12005438-Ditylum_brightwellii.AAC.1
MPDIMDILQWLNPYCCGLKQTKTFEMMGFSTAIDGPPPQFNNWCGSGHVETTMHFKLTGGTCPTTVMQQVV